MVKARYVAKPKIAAKSAKAMGTDLSTSYKNTYNVCAAIRGWDLQKAKTYLEDVLQKKQIIPFLRHNLGCGRQAQTKQFNVPTRQGRWPIKSVKIVMDMLKNAEANAEFKQLDTENMTIEHIAVNRAPKGRRRTYRAHGRMGAYMSQPCHIEMIITEDSDDVEKSEEASKTIRFTRKQLARHRLTVGGGVAGAKQNF